MRTVFTSPSIIEVYKGKSLLDDEEINCIIANENISFLAGEVPYAATWPQIDVINDSDFDRAKEVLKGMTPKDITGENWTCTSCMETHEPQFEICWKCSAVKPFK